MNNLEKSLRFVAKHYKKGAFNPEKGWEKVTGQQKRILFRPAVWRSAVAVAVLAIVAGAFLLNPVQEKTVTAHELQKISVLPDNSKITLEPGAVLTYDKKYGKTNRLVSLSGDANFEVSRDEILPFTVQTTSAEITVLGTVFNVSSGEKTTSLEVQSGKVQFEPLDFPVSFICTQGMKADYNLTQKEITISSLESLCTINQMDNLLKFNNMQLSEVSQILEEYFGVKISVPENDKNLRLTSTFNNKKLEEVLEIINLTLDSRITAP